MNDHKEKAESMLKVAAELGNIPDVDLGKLVEGAHAYATLYLAEQQRIANLLTLAQFDHRAERNQRAFTGLAFATQLRFEAAEALGVAE